MNKAAPIKAVQRFSPEETKSLVNTGFYIKGKPSAAKEKTLFIVGLERSGTSMIAKILHELDIHMGDQYNEAVFEDREMAKYAEGNDIAQLSKLVEEKNAAHDIWAWKRPRAYRYAKRLEKIVRNPHYIILFRDPLAIALRNNISVHLSVEEGLEKAIQETTDLIAFLKDNKYPCLCVSYEKALQNKHALVESMANFMGLSLSKEDIAVAVNSIENGNTQYLSNSAIRSTQSAAVSANVSRIKKILPEPIKRILRRCRQMIKR